MRLIDADSLKRKFEECRYLFSAHGMYPQNLVDYEPTVNGWISVEDRLPDVDQRVLVSLVSELDGHRMKRPELGYTTDPAGKMWFITTWKEWAIDSDLEVTHWMPLPEPPEEVSGDA